MHFQTLSHRVLLFKYKGRKACSTGGKNQGQQKAPPSAPWAGLSLQGVAQRLCYKPSGSENVQQPNYDGKESDGSTVDTISID